MMDTQGSVQEGRYKCRSGVIPFTSGSNQRIIPLKMSKSVYKNGALLSHAFHFSPLGADRLRWETSCSTTVAELQLP